MRTLVEASPRDRTWGIGLGASNPKATDKRLWRGSNWLGEILTQVREELKDTGAGEEVIKVSETFQDIDTERTD